MQISGIALQNFRSYRDATSVKDFADVNTFIGPNAVGKSSILESFRLLGALNANAGMKPYPELVFDKSSDNMRVELVLTPSSNDRSQLLSTLFGSNGVVTRKMIVDSQFLTRIACDFEITANGVTKEEIRIANIQNGDLSIIKKNFENGIRRPQSILLDRVCNQISEFRNIPPVGFEFRGNTNYGQGFDIWNYEGVDTTEQNLARMLKGCVSHWIFFPPSRQAAARMPLGEDSALDPSGSNLTRFLNSLQSNQPRKFVELENTLSQILPIVKEILAPTRGQQAAIEIIEEGLTSAIDLANASYGLTQILILVYGILNAEDDTVIFIEEPELHLHAGSQRRMFELMQQLARAHGKQFFVTSHSSVFTGCNQKVRTYLISKKDGISSVKEIQEPLELRLIKDSLGHKNTDLYGDECVVFIEGESEDVALPIIANAMGFNLVEMGIRLINIRGSGKLQKIDEFLNYMRGSDVLLYVIADGSKEVSKKIEDWKRAGLLEENCATVWEAEFEDCIEADILSKALFEIGLKPSEKFDWKSEIEKSRKEKESVIRLIRRVTHENDLPDLDKPALAEKIAGLIRLDIEGNEKHQRTLPEVEIEKIINLVKNR